eukprot:scaffold20.g7890.t1
MDADLGFSRAVYGLGASLFFVPGAAACVALGARRWLTLILVAWGIVAMACAAITNEAGFLTLRLLLGLAEAGTFPGIYFHLSSFYDARSIGAAYTWVTSSTAAAGLIGGLLAAALMLLGGARLAGWRLVFLVEGALPLLLSAAVWRWLPATPLSASFLAPAEQELLWRSVHGTPEVELAGAGAAAEHGEAANGGEEGGEVAKLHRGADSGGDGAPPAGRGAVRGALLAGLRDWRIWWLGVIWSLIEFGMSSTHFWVPQLVKTVMQGGLDADGDEVESTASLGEVVRASLLAAVPFAAAGIVMIANAHHARRCDERRWHTAMPLLVASAAFLALPVLARLGPGAGLAALAAAAAGVWAVHGPLFSWPAAILGHGSSAVGFAMIKTVGTLGSFAGPLLVGLLTSRGHGFGGAMLMLAGVCGAAALLAATFPGEGAHGYRSVDTG